MWPAIRNIFSFPCRQLLFHFHTYLAKIMSEYEGGTFRQTVCEKGYFSATHSEEKINCDEASLSWY
jgi:hypothetical protein